MVDSARAEQISNEVLARVGASDCKVIVVDIAGVPVVDTAVADTLVKLGAMVLVLGLTMVLTGISAPIARTMVRLGVNTEAMHTCSSLKEGLSVAYGLVGKAVVARPMTPRSSP